MHKNSENNYKRTTKKTQNGKNPPRSRRRYGENIPRGRRKSGGASSFYFRFGYTEYGIFFAAVDYAALL